MTLNKERRNAIESGVNNAIETVIVDKAMTRDEAYASLRSFVEDGLACAGIRRDIATEEDMNYARSLWSI